MEEGGAEDDEEESDSKDLKLAVSRGSKLHLCLCSSRKRAQ